MNDMAPRTNPELRPEWRTRENAVPVARYVSREFAELERTCVWGKSWQMAARIDQLRRPGDYCVYEILDDSVVVVRAADMSIRAYHNVCPHRATTLAVGSGNLPGETFTCPFHGWQWNTLGENTYVLDPQEFKHGCLTAEDLALKQVAVELWAGSVWINLDADPIPFADHIAPIRDMVDAVRLADMRFYWHRTIVAPCNWKVVLEAFMEAYHVGETHPQLVRSFPDNETYNRAFAYETFANGHGLFGSAAGGGTGSQGRISPEQARTMSRDAQVDALVEALTTQSNDLDAQILAADVEIARSMRHRELAEGELVGAAFQRVLRETYAAQGRPIGSVEAMRRFADMNIFPHVVFLPAFGNAIMYRARPLPDNNPDMCQFDVYSLRTYPEGIEPPEWQTTVVTDPAGPDGFRLIPNQDIGNIARVQRGLHSRAIKLAAFSDRQEIMITNHHRQIDRMIDRG